MAYSNHLTRISKVGVDAKVLADTLITITENGTQKFHPLFVIFKVSSGSVITLVPTISIGTNSTSYDNIIPATLLTGLISVDKYIKADIIGVIDAVSANTSIYCKVTGIATATTMVVDVHIFGYYN